MPPLDPFWLQLRPWSLLASIVLSCGFIIAALWASFAQGKTNRTGALGLWIAAAACLLYLLDMLISTPDHILLRASDFAWGPALALWGWCGFSIYPGLEKARSFSFVPLIAMFLYLFRKGFFEDAGLEAVAIYSSLMTLPMLAAAVAGEGKGRVQLGLGMLLMGMGLSGSFWLHELNWDVLDGGSLLICLLVPAAGSLAWGLYLRSEKAGNPVESE